MTENPLVLIAELDYCYFVLEQLHNELEKRSGLDKMIDSATGYDLEYASQAVRTMCWIIRRKRRLGYNFESERKLLKDVLEIKKGLKKK